MWTPLATSALSASRFQKWTSCFKPTRAISNRSLSRSAFILCIPGNQSCCTSDHCVGRFLFMLKYMCLFPKFLSFTFSFLILKMDNLIYLSIIILTSIGFGIAAHIFFEKKKNKPMVCLMNFKCEDVLYSKYASFLGIPNDILGMLYYLVVGFGFAAVLFYPAIPSNLLLFVLSITITSGFLFSLYLVSIQAFKIKEWCSWCLMSAIISLSIFILLTQTTFFENQLVNLAANYSYIIIPLYACILAVGISISTLSEILFFRFLSDNVISKEESDVLDVAHQVVWTALILLIISNYTLFIAGEFNLFSKPRFFAKIFVLAVLVFTSFVYELFVSSKIIEKYNKSRSLECGSERVLRKTSFILGPIIVFSWYSILLLETSVWLPLSAIQIIALYLVVLLMVGIGGLRVRRNFYP